MWPQVVGIGKPNDSFLRWRQPCGWVASPVGNVGSAHEINVATGKYLVDQAIPELVNFLVIINHADEITVSGCNTRIQGMGAALFLFEDVMKPSGELRLVSLHSLACGVG